MAGIVVGGCTGSERGAGSAAGTASARGPAVAPAGGFIPWRAERCRCWGHLSCQLSAVSFQLVRQALRLIAEQLRGWRRRFACGVWTGESPVPPGFSALTMLD